MSSHSNKSSLGEGGGYSRMGIFSNSTSNNKQHDSASHASSWAATTNKYNNTITNQYPSDKTDLAKNSHKNYHYPSVSEIKSTNLLSPALVSKVAKLKLSKVHDSSEEYSAFHHLSRSQSRSSSSSSAASTGTVCESEIFPYGKGIKPHQRRLRSTSPPSRTVTPTRSEVKCEGNVDVGAKTKDNKDVAADVISSGELESKLSEKEVKACDEAAGSNRMKLTPDLEIDKSVVSSPDISHTATTFKMSNRHKFVPSSVAANVHLNHPAEDDNNSVSTVSGSGIDFFRKFVQRKGSSCKDCEEQFRREVLIDRLVSDSMNTKAVLAKKSIPSKCSSAASESSSSVASSTAAAGMNSRPVSDMSDDSHNSVNHSLIVSSLGMHELEQKARGCASRCKTHRNNFQSNLCDEVQSVSTKSSLSRSSSISGSGLLFLRNYLKKKKSKSKNNEQADNTSFNKNDPKNISAFNIVPVPFPPPSDFYGPAYYPDGGPDSEMSEDSSSGRRNSMCSTVADLLNEDFDCDDSELKNLDWEEWDEPLPDEISYDDLVSVISESFYSEDLDISDLCEIDWEGRKTVVANENQVLTPADRDTDKDLRGRGVSKANVGDYTVTSGRSVSPPPPPPQSQQHQQEGIDIPTKSKYSSTSFKSGNNSFKSSTFLQDLEAELELPPMTPVSDEKEEAVRALSRTIKSYMRTGSNSSYTSCNNDSSGSGSVLDRRHSRLSNYHNEQGRYTSSGKTGEELERNSRMSVYSPAMSDYLPELVSTNSSSTCVSPLQQQPYRRPLSQLLIYDGPQESSIRSPSLTKRPYSQIYYSSNDDHSSTISRERSKTPSPEMRPAENSTESNSISSGHIFSQNSNLHKRTSVQQQQQQFEGKLQESGAKLEAGGGGASDLMSSHDHLRLLDQLRPDYLITKAANRDSLLCPHDDCSSPSLHPPPSAPTMPHSPNISAVSRPYMRHSSCNSTDSGCHLLEEKLASVSPTPSPRTNFESVLTNNRNKLASFWEKSISNSNTDVTHSSWLPNRDNGLDETHRHGFKPFKSAFGSENSLIVTDRLNQFQDITRRAAERNCVIGVGGRGASGSRHDRSRSHRASTGSDLVSDTDFLEKITLSPTQPRRRDSFAEYFV